MTTKRFGAYEILHELKSGGMGSVLLGRRRGPGAFEQIVAIKTILAEYAQAAAVRAMFLDEAAILARIQHPGIATVHDFGEEDGTLYMVMEYVAGNSFRTLIDGPMPPSVAARAIAEACRGVHAAHEVRDRSGALLGVVHRDLSPDNLMLGFDGHVKVIDFGIALIKNRQAPVTEFGTVKGKPPYMSPEQVKNEAMDRRSDVFSLGVCLHEMLTGQPLFIGDSIYAIARAVEHQALVPPSQVVGSPLPAGLDAAVMRALDRDPATRTPTAAQLAEELERVIGAAGEETLEAWADRELAAAREAHRAWIAGVIAGRDAPKPAVGRATGAVTAVGPQALAALGLSVASAPVLPGAPAMPGAPDVSDAHAKTALAPAALLERSVTELGRDAPPPERRPPIAVLIIGTFVLVAAIVVVIAMTRGSATPARDAGVVGDAAIALDAPTVVVVAISDLVVDAALDAPADALAETLIDAGRRTPSDAGRTPPIDAGRTPARDAAVVQADAAVVQASGTGTVSIFGPRGSYATIVLDGKSLGPTPILDKVIPAGSHTIEFIPPVGDATYKTTFELAPGEKKNLKPPTT